MHWGNDASENTRDCRFKIRTPKPSMPRKVGAIRICVSNLANGSRCATSSFSSNEIGKSSSKQTSATSEGWSCKSFSSFSSRPNFEAALATQRRSASLSNARGRADHMIKWPPPGIGFTTAASVSTGRTLAGRSLFGKDSRPLWVAQKPFTGVASGCQTASKPLRTYSAPDAKPWSRFKIPRLQITSPSCQTTKPSALVNRNKTELIQEISIWTSDGKVCFIASVWMEPGFRDVGLAETCRRAASSKRPPTHGIDQARTENTRAKASLTWRKLSTSPVVVALLYTSKAKQHAVITRGSIVRSSSPGMRKRIIAKSPPRARIVSLLNRGCACTAKAARENREDLPRVEAAQQFENCLRLDKWCRACELPCALGCGGPHGVTFSKEDNMAPSRVCLDKTVTSHNCWTVVLFTRQDAAKKGTIGQRMVTLQFATKWHVALWINRSPCTMTFGLFIWPANCGLVLVQCGVWVRKISTVKSQWPMAHYKRSIDPEPWSISNLSNISVMNFNADQRSGYAWTSLIATLDAI